MFAVLPNVKSCSGKRTNIQPYFAISLVIKEKASYFCAIGFFRE